MFIGNALMKKKTCTVKYVTFLDKKSTMWLMNVFKVKDAIVIRLKSYTLLSACVRTDTYRMKDAIFTILFLWQTRNASKH